MLKTDRHLNYWIFQFSRGLLASAILALPSYGAEQSGSATKASASEEQQCVQEIRKKEATGDAFAKYLAKRGTELAEYCESGCDYQNLKVYRANKTVCDRIFEASSSSSDCKSLKEEAEKKLDEFDKQCGKLGLGKGCADEIDGEDSCVDAIDAFMESGKKLNDCKALANDKSCSFANSPTPKKEDKKEDSTDSKIKKLVNGEKGGINISLTNGEKDKEKTPAEQLAEIDKNTNDRLQSLDKEEAAAKRNARATDLKVDQNYVNNRAEQRNAILAVARAKDKHFENCQNYSQQKLNALDAKVKEQDAIIKLAKQRKTFRVNATRLAGFKNRRLKIINDLREQSYHKDFHECIEGIVAIGKESQNQILAAERQKEAIDQRFTDQSFVLEKERANGFIELNEELTRINTARQNTINTAAQSKQAIMQAEEKKQQEEQRKKMEELMKQIADMATPDDQKTCNPDFIKEVREKYSDLKTGNSSYQRARRACEGLRKCSDVSHIGCGAVGITLGGSGAASSSSNSDGFRRASRTSSQTHDGNGSNNRSAAPGSAKRYQSQPTQALPPGQADQVTEQQNSTGGLGK